MALLRFLMRATLTECTAFVEKYNVGTVYHLVAMLSATGRNSYESVGFEHAEPVARVGIGQEKKSLIKSSGLHPLPFLVRLLQAQYTTATIMELLRFTASQTLESVGASITIISTVWTFVPFATQDSFLGNLNRAAVLQIMQ